MIFIIIMSVVRLHETTQLPMDGFPWKLISEDFFQNLTRKFKIH